MAETAVDPLEARKEHARAWFEELREQICAAFEALEDEAPAALYRGQYDDETGARETLRMLSGGGLRAAWTKALGLAMNNIRFAKRGDVALVEVGGVEAAGVVVGSRVACATEGGFMLVPASRIVAAWSV